MSKSTISTFELFQMFPDAEAARVYMEGKRWPDGAVCPACDEAKRITTRKGGFYRCNACKTDFTVRTATIFERSHIPLHKWLYAMYLLVTARKGISSLQLAKQIGVTQKSAWFMLQRLREACGNAFRSSTNATTSRDGDLLLIGGIMFLPSRPIRPTQTHPSCQRESMRNSPSRMCCRSTQAVARKSPQ